MAESHREEIAKLEALYANHPTGRVFVHLAEAYRKAGEYERARIVLDEGIARHPDAASAYVVQGRLLKDLGENPEAESAFRRVLDLDTGNLVALRGLGDLALADGRVEDALASYRDLLARNPSNEEVRVLVAETEREVSAVAEAPLAPASAAPGDTGPAAAAEPEFGIVELTDAATTEMVADAVQDAGGPDTEAASGPDTEAAAGPGAEEAWEAETRDAGVAAADVMEPERADEEAGFDLSALLDAAMAGPIDLGSREPPPEPADLDVDLHVEAEEEEPDATSPPTQLEDLEFEAVAEPAGGSGVQEAPEGGAAAHEPGPGDWAAAEDTSAEALTSALDIDVGADVARWTEMVEAHHAADVPDVAAAASADVGSPEDEPSPEPAHTVSTDAAPGGDEVTRLLTSGDDMHAATEPATGSLDEAGARAHAEDEAAQEEPLVAPAFGDTAGEDDRFVAYEDQVVVYDEVAVHDEEAVVHDEEAVVHDEEAVVYDEEPIVHDGEAVVYDEEVVVYDEEVVTYDEEVVAYDEEVGRDDEIAADGGVVADEEGSVGVDAGEPLAESPDATAWTGAWTGPDASAEPVTGTDLEPAAELDAGAAWSGPDAGAADAPPLEDDATADTHAYDAYAYDAYAYDAEDASSAFVPADAYSAGDEPGDEAADIAGYAEEVAGDLETAGADDSPGATGDEAVISQLDTTTFDSHVPADEESGEESETVVGTDESVDTVASEIAARDETGVAAAPAAEGGSWQRTAAAPFAGVEAGDSGLETETIADLYRRQGLDSRAADVYRALLRRRPDDGVLRAKLAEVEQQARRRAVLPPPSAPAEADVADVETWLLESGTMWAGGSASAGAATPYAWTGGEADEDGEDDEAVAGAPIGTYLRELASWRRTTPADADVTVEDAVDADAAGEAVELGRHDRETISRADTAAESALPPLPEHGGYGTATGADPVQAAFDEWYGTPDPAASGSGTAVDRGADDPEESQDDEDLAMFRSWLQSLKK
jgi:tetratricopeptide (TPR) repeat protein